MQLNEHRLDREREKIERGMERELDCWDPVRNTRLSISGRVRWMMSVVYCGSEWSWLVWKIDGGVMPLHLTVWGWTDTSAAQGPGVMCITACHSISPSVAPYRPWDTLASDTLYALPAAHTRTEKELPSSELPSHLQCSAHPLLTAPVPLFCLQSPQSTQIQPSTSTQTSIPPDTHLRTHTHPRT